jgi:RNA polymerase sigma factor FliA
MNILLSIQGKNMEKTKKLVKHKPEQIWIDYTKESNTKKKELIKQKLVEKYYPLVKKIAFSLAMKLNWHISDDELSSFGVDGLYIAIRRYDIDQGVKFEYYASLRIRGSMLDGLRKEDRIPRSVRINNNLYNETKFYLEAVHCRKITEIEVIEEMGIDKTVYFQNVKKFKPNLCSSLYGISSDEKSSSEEFKQDHNDSLIDKDVDSPDHSIKRQEFFNKLVGKNFSVIERNIIYLYYYKNYNMKRISDKIGYSESRISQIHRNILPRLKNKITRNPEYFDDIYEYIKKI